MVLDATYILSKKKEHPWNHQSIKWPCYRKYSSWFREIWYRNLRMISELTVSRVCSVRQVTFLHWSSDNWRMRSAWTTFAIRFGIIAVWWARFVIAFRRAVMVCPMQTGIATQAWQKNCSGKFLLIWMRSVRTSGFKAGNTVRCRDASSAWSTWSIRQRFREPLSMLFW